MYQGHVKRVISSSYSFLWTKTEPCWSNFAAMILTTLWHSWHLTQNLKHGLHVGQTDQCVALPHGSKQSQPQVACGVGHLVQVIQWSGMSLFLSCLKNIGCIPEAPDISPRVFAWPTLLSYVGGVASNSLLNFPQNPMYNTEISKSIHIISDVTDITNILSVTNTSVFLNATQMPCSLPCACLRQLGEARWKSVVQKSKETSWTLPFDTKSSDTKSSPTLWPQNTFIILELSI